jgi:hypothetical protein
MTKTLNYNAANIKKIYANLVSLNSQGVPKDYEIRIDDLTVVHRTNDLSKFYLLQESITNYSSEMHIILYKGKARRYDKFIFYLNNNQHSNSKLLTQESVDQKVKEILAIKETEYELERLRSDNETQQQLISDLEIENKALKVKNSGELKEMMKVFGSQFNTPTPVSSGASPDKMMQMIGEARKKFGEEVFNDVLGIALITGENPEIIKDVVEFVNTKIQDNENK